MIATRFLLGFLLPASAVALAAAGCASKTQAPAGEPRYTIVRGDETPPPTAGVPPDKEVEIQLVLQRHEVTTRRCYQDVLAQKQGAPFQGTVRLLISLGTDGRATEVKASGGTLGDKEVESCLVQAVKSFEFPTLTQPGDVQYELLFRPAF